MRPSTKVTSDLFVIKIDSIVTTIMHLTYVKCMCLVRCYVTSIQTKLVCSSVGQLGEAVEMVYSAPQSALSSSKGAVGAELTEQREEEHILLLIG